MTSALIAPSFMHDRPHLYSRVIPDRGGALACFVRDAVRRYAPGIRVLDVGCGPGRELAALRAGGLRADGLDASPAMVAAARAASPDSTVWFGLQTDFGTDEQYDAISCLGHAFCYNYDVEAIERALAEFHAHLAPAGLLVLDLRNAAHFLTPEGQRLLDTDLHGEVPLEDGVLRYISRIEISTGTQLLERHYEWHLPGEPPVTEHLQHRLLFPQELTAHLRWAGFEVIEMFDSPAPALGRYDGLNAPRSRALTGKRLQVIARKVRP